MTRWKHAGVAALSLAALLAGCGTTAPSRFYVLQSSANTEAVLPGKIAPDAIVGIGPVTLPEYLDRPQMVTRAGDNRLDLAEFDRWAEPLGGNFTRVLADNVSRLLSTERVVLFPWPSSVQVDYKVAVEVMEFEAGPGGIVTLDARWTVFGGGDSAVRRSHFEEQAPGGYEAIAAAQSKMLGKLSLEIASAIAELAGD